MKIVENLLNSGVIPSNIKELTPQEIKTRTVPLSEFNSESESHIGDDRVVVADDAEWVGIHKSGTFSIDSNNIVWRTSKQNKSITRSEFVDGFLLPTKLINLTKKHLEEEQQMANESQADALLKELNNQEDKAGTGSIDPSASFSDAELAKADKERKEREKKEKLEKLQNQLSNDTAGVQVGSIRDLNIFASEYGELYGYLMGNAPKIVFGTKTEKIKDASGRPVLKSTVSPAKKAEYAAAKAGVKVEGIENKDYESQKEFNFRQSGPTQMLGIVLAAPAGALLTPKDLRESEIKFDKTKTDLVTMVLQKDQGQSYIASYFGGQINESAATHATPGVVTCVYKLKSDKNGNNTYRAEMKSTRGKLYEEGNWIARKTPKTIPLATVLNDPKKADELDLITFGGFFESKENVMSTYDKLSVSAKAKLKKEGNKITSDFFHKTGAFPDIAPYYNADKRLPLIEIPVKERHLKKNSNTEYTTKAVVYDVLNPDEKLKDLDPSTDGRFSKFLSVLPSGKSLKDVFSEVSTKTTSSSGRGNEVVLSPEDSLRLVQTTLNNPVKGFKSFTDKDQAQQLADKIQKLAYKADKERQHKDDK